MSDGPAAIVAGFADPASGICALGWQLGETRGGLLLAGGEVEGAEVELGDSGDEVTLALSAPGASCEATLTPSEGSLTVIGSDGASPAFNSLDVVACAVGGSLVRGDAHGLECRGHITRWRSSPEAIPATTRHLAMTSEEGAVMVVVAAGPAAAEGHGDEQTQAWLIDVEGTITPFQEALLSTEYDDSGAQRRFNLELWPTDSEAQPMRESGTALGQVSNGTAVAAFEFAGDAGAGLGAYLIERR
ncbi:MAG: hypothetical protein EXQ70_08470 [Solirubrobacterales bacterium]|nr:hypothetical protein [Solirubrobacterales bacterium]